MASQFIPRQARGHLCLRRSANNTMISPFTGGSPPPGWSLVQLSSVVGEHLLQPGEEELQPGVLRISVLLYYGMQRLSLRGVLLQGAVDRAGVVLARCVVVPSRGRVKDRTSKREACLLAHLEVKHESHIGRESGLIIDDVSMTVILVRTTTPPLLQVLTAVRVMSRFSSTPVLSQVKPCSVPAIVSRIGRIGSGEVAIIYSLFRSEIGTVIA